MLNWASKQHRIETKQKHKKPHGGQCLSVLLIENCNRVSLGIEKSNPFVIPDLMLLGIINSQHDGHWHVHDRPIIESERVEMKRLEELGFSHEASEGCGPSFAEDMDPLQVNPWKLDPRQRKSLTLLQVSFWIIPHHKLHQLPSVWFDQRVRNSNPHVPPRREVRKYVDFRGWGEMGIEGFGERVGGEGGLGEESGHGRHWRVVL